MSSEKMTKRSKNVMVLGKGAREHALGWKLSLSTKVDAVYICPGNGGTFENQPKLSNVELNPENTEELTSWIRQNNIAFVVIGPEVLLEKGIVDNLGKIGVPCFGPTSEAAEIESSKKWSKEFMQRNDMPTAKWQSFTDAERAKDFIKKEPNEKHVIKASGLAEGKGVFVCLTSDEACEAVDKVMGGDFGSAGSVILIEEMLDGEEVSVLAFSDGNSVKIMPPTQDYKNLKNNDHGPNTGGMGAYCPYPLSDKQMNYVENEILKKAVRCLKEESRPFVGVLYAGLMLTTEGIKVLEFNCRFGDPEAQVILPLLETDLFDVIEACCDGTLDHCEIKWKTRRSTVGIVLASEGYPTNSIIDKEITGLPLSMPIDSFVFHAGTKKIDGCLYTSGGRVLTVVAIDDCLISACARAFRFCNEIHFSGKQFRTDIGHKGIVRSILKKGGGTYKDAGVDITAGNVFIERSKEKILSTHSEINLNTIGSFAAVIDPVFKNYQDPVLVTCCDGVGTKLRVAQDCSKHNTIGQDLVAMCVNDLLAHGGKPLFFLDYISIGKIDEHIVDEIMSGIVDGCKLAKCSLAGGETAEMPGFYSDGEYDLAGFAVGIVERPLMLPKEINVGDCLIYLPSSGFHSNGYSLLRKIMTDQNISYQDDAPFSAGRDTYATEFLKPTRIYVDKIVPLVEKQLIKAFIHVTGGGILENVVRAIPSNMKVVLNAMQWETPTCFGWVSLIGNVGEDEMLRTFNCGVGGIVIVDPIHGEEVAASLDPLPLPQIGEIRARESENEPQIEVTNITRALGRQMRSLIHLLTKREIMPYKRVAVFISGRGSNLESLIKNLQNDPKCKAKVVLVVSNKANATGLRFADEYNIPKEIFVRDRSRTDDENDNLLKHILSKHNIDIICLAGYMQILSTNFVDKWRGKMLNIHPSLLPSFKGLNAQAQALEAGVKITGCTVHFVEPEVDSGAIIEQSSVLVKESDTIETLSDRILEKEHEIYPRALKQLAAGMVALNLETGKAVWK